MTVFRQLLEAGRPITLETASRQQLSRADAATLDRLARGFVIDQTSMTMFPGSPFAELAARCDVQAGC